MLVNSDLCAYFGYGSLVNRASLRTNIVDAFPATLTGWRRHWQARPDDTEDIQFPDHIENPVPIALLNVHQERNCQIDGLIIIDKRENLEAVDVREAAYKRVALDVSDIDMRASNLPAEMPVEIYVAQDWRNSLPQAGILRSYLDVVLAGFDNEFGEHGMDRFVETTLGFDAPLIEDRDAPAYPRYHSPSERQLARMDALFPLR